LEDAYDENDRIKDGVDVKLKDINVNVNARGGNGVDVIIHTASHFGNPPFGSFGSGRLEEEE